MTDLIQYALIGLLAAAVVTGFILDGRRRSLDEKHVYGPLRELLERDTQEKP